MPQFALAELLLRRKELSEKVAILKNLKGQPIYEVIGKRVKVTDSIDDLAAQVPKLTASQVTGEYDWHAKQLRLVDAAIQKANWETKVDVADTVMGDYTPVELPRMQLSAPAGQVTVG